MKRPNSNTMMTYLATSIKLHFIMIKIIIQVVPTPRRLDGVWNYVLTSNILLISRVVSNVCKYFENI